MVNAAEAFNMSLSSIRTAVKRQQEHCHHLFVKLEYVPGDYRVCMECFKEMNGNQF
jgi:hypothetical protein